MHKVDFYFDFISPYSYMAATRLAGFSQRHDVTFRWRPINLPRLIKLSGNIPPATIPNKARYLMRDLKRWAEILDVPFKLIMPGSFDSRPALNIAGELSDGERARFSLVVFEEIWSGRISTKQNDWLEQILAVRNLPLAWLSITAEKETDTLRQNTEAALKAGAFGAPSFVYHGQRNGRPQLFFGVDRLDFLARAIEQDHG